MAEEESFLMSSVLKDQIYEVIRGYLAEYTNTKNIEDSGDRIKWFNRRGSTLKPFEMKDTVEQSLWSFDVSGQAYPLDWDDYTDSWIRRDGADLEVMWASEFMEGTAFGDFDVESYGNEIIGDVVWVWFNKLSGRWWIIEGGQTFIDVEINYAIDQGSSGSASVTMPENDDRVIDVMIYAEFSALASGKAQAHWDAKHGRWSGIQGGGSGAQIIGFEIVSVDCELCKAVVTVISRPAGVTSVPEEDSYTGEVTVYDFAGCHLDATEIDLIGKFGYATYMDGPEFCAIDPDKGSRWEIMTLCCAETECQ